LSIRSAFASLITGVLILPATLAAQDGGTGVTADSFAVASVELVQASRPERQWEQEWKLEISRGGSAPLVWTDSLLLVASLDRNLHLVSTAPPEPRVRFKENFKGGFSAAPVVADGRILLPELEAGGRLVALDRSTRGIAWTADAGDLASSPVVEGDRIYTVSSIGELRAWRDTGAELWRVDLETRVIARPVILGDVLVVASSDGRMHAYDALTGTALRSASPAAGPIWGDPVVLSGSSGAGPTAVFATLGGQLLEIGADLAVVRQRSFPSRFFAGPARAGDRLYLAGHEGTVWCYNWMTDAIDWRLDLDDATVRMSPALGEDDLAVGDLQGTLTIVDRARGVVEWTTRLDGALTSTPLFHGDELYALTERGTLYAFRPIIP
jgi:outer membrane protein assembly factor BamB